jgi:hypothetical protein
MSWYEGDIHMKMRRASLAKYILKGVVSHLEPPQEKCKF